MIEYLYIFIVKMCNASEDDYEMDLAGSPYVCFLLDKNPIKKNSDTGGNLMDIFMLRQSRSPWQDP